MEKLQIIANQVRSFAEQYAYDNYLNRNLCGVCAIATAKLSEMMYNNGINSEIIITRHNYYGHCYLVADYENEKYMVDVTATQFKDFKDNKIIIEKKYKTGYWFWDNIMRIATCKQHLVQLLSEDCWPSSQIPY